MFLCSLVSLSPPTRSLPAHTSAVTFNKRHPKMDINQKQSEDKHLDISTSQQTKACETKPVFS